MFGTALRNSLKRVQGLSCKKRKQTSKVAPPQTSILKVFGWFFAKLSATFSMS